MNVIRRSQIIGLITMDGSTATKYDRVEEVWVEDFLFDWETGDIAAYILGGEIAESFGGKAVLFPDDVETIDAQVIVIKEEAKNRLKSESEGIKGFLSEKSQQVKNLAGKMSDRLHYLVSPQDRPEVVRVKIKEVSDELAASSQHDKTNS